MIPISFPSMVSGEKTAIGQETYASAKPRNSCPLAIRPMAEEAWRT